MPQKRRCLTRALASAPRRPLLGPFSVPKTGHRRTANGQNSCPPRRLPAQTSEVLETSEVSLAVAFLRCAATLYFLFWNPRGANRPYCPACSGAAGSYAKVCRARVTITIATILPVVVPLQSKAARLPAGAQRARNNGGCR